MKLRSKLGVALVSLVVTFNIAFPHPKREFIERITSSTYVQVTMPPPPPPPLRNYTVCPTNVTEAWVRFSNQSMFATGPDDCVIPQVRSPPALYLGDTWTISLGASGHWLSSMAFLRTLAILPYPTSMDEYNRSCTPNCSRWPPDIIEALVTQDGSFVIRTFESFRNYSSGGSQPKGSVRFTVVHARFHERMENVVSRLVPGCTKNPLPDLLLDITGNWYRMCSKRPTLEDCQYLNWEITMKKTQQMKIQMVKAQQLKELRSLIDSITNSSRPLSRMNHFFTSYHSEISREFKSAISQSSPPGSHTHIHHDLKNYNDTFPMFENHHPGAVSLGISSVWLHKLLKPGINVAVDECVIMDGLGCSAVDSNEQGFVDAKQHGWGGTRQAWAIPGFQMCTTTPCDMLTIPTLERPEKNGISDPWIGFNLGATNRIFAFGATSEVRWAWTFASMAVVAWYVKQEQSGEVRQHSMLGLGTVRFIASIHIVAGHLQRYGRSVMMPIPLADFGYSWVPWFMMLSGFVLSWSKLRGNQKDVVVVPWLTFLRKRLLSIYPVYAAGIFATLVVSNSFSTITYRRLVVDLLLTQAWYPTWTENAIMPHTWFLSAIWPLWALHGVIYRLTVAQSTKTLLTLCMAAAAIPIIAFALVPLLPSLECWWCGHVHGRSDAFLDLLVIVLKFHPICYAPTYISGVASAVIAHRWQQLHLNRKDEPHTLIADIIVRFGTLFGAAGLVMSFSISRVMQFRGSKLAFRLGMLLPFHALLLAGLAVGSERDYLRRVFEARLLQSFGSISFSQYTFQFIWFHLWRERVDACFWVWCVAGSIAVAIVVDQPFRKRDWMTGLCGIGATVFFVQSIIWMTRFEVGKDVSIALSSASDSGHQRWINPSVAWEGSKLVVAARRHEVQTSGSTTIWYADVGLGTLNTTTFQPTGTMEIIRSAESSNPCINEQLQDQGKLRYIIGQEDPRLLKRNGTAFLTTVIYEKHGEECVARQTLGLPNAGKADVILKDDRVMTSSKNWMHLENDLFMVNVTTQTVVRVDPFTGISTVFSEGNVDEALAHKNIHGGSNFVASEIDGEDIWLGVVHTAVTYQNLLLEFNKAAPFELRRISSPLPLTVLSSPSNHSKIGGAFASGLAELPGGGLLITYGSSDIEARAFSLDRFGVRALFSATSCLLSF